RRRYPLPAVAADALSPALYGAGKAGQHRAGRGEIMRTNLLRLFYPLAGIALILIAWHLYVALLRVPTVVLPGPLQVSAATATHFRILLEESWVTTLECIYGFALALGIGIPIAVVMTYSRVANQMFYPLLVASQSIPKVAVAPILLVWFGTG